MDMLLYGHHISGREIEPMSTILYARVSTAEQTIAHQRTQAEAAGFTIDEVIHDEGVSGISTKLAGRASGCSTSCAPATP
jgi:predicted site-specific integrase-resolvase